MAAMAYAMSLPPYDGGITSAWTHRDPFPGELVAGPVEVLLGAAT
jgi:hypothetical protein